MRRENKRCRYCMLKEGDEKYSEFVNWTVETVKTALQKPPFIFQLPLLEGLFLNQFNFNPIQKIEEKKAQRMLQKGFYILTVSVSDGNIVDVADPLPFSQISNLN